MRYPIPPASAKAWQEYQGKPGIRNPSLLFDRFLPDLSHHKKPNDKKEALKSFIRAMSNVDKRLLEAWQQRFKVGVRATYATPFIMQSDWRFVTGLGRKGALEVGFTFHRYGFPILPGSSVKGIARAYAQQVEGLDEEDRDFVTIFGKATDFSEAERTEQNKTESQAGSAIFYDAIPAALPTLELDVMTPHFSEYYQDEKWPTDSQPTIPIPFLTVAPNTRFLFAVGWRGKMDEKAQHLRELAQTWLIKGLETLGAGAKTSAGYGFFDFKEQLAEEEAQAEAASVVVVDAEEVQITQLIGQVEAMLPKNVPSQINTYYNEWRNFKGSEQQKRRLAEAIRKKVESDKKYHKKAKEKAWYREIEASL